ncbi:MAG: ribosome maturation factor RimM [Acidimicrobiia bacterium]
MPAPRNSGTSELRNLVPVGTIVRPHGLKGDVVVQPETDFGDTRFRKGAIVHARIGAAEVVLTIVASRPQADRWIIRLAGHESIEAAEALRGVELLVDADTAPLPEGSYYLHDLVGCEVVTEGGLVVGPVSVVYSGAAQPVLGIAGEAGEVLVPLVEAICRKVDVTARRIVIAPPEGLLEANR